MHDMEPFFKNRLGWYYVTVSVRFFFERVNLGGLSSTRVFFYC